MVLVQLRKVSIWPKVWFVFDIAMAQTECVDNLVCLLPMCYLVNNRKRWKDWPNWLHVSM